MSDRPNFLLITADQQRFDTIAALGNSHIYTPHLDWLCDEGIAFTRAYSDCPVCMPARATIMAGRHGYTLGITGNQEDVLPLAENPTLPGLLTRAGYQTRAQGKMHFYPMRANYGFEHMELPMDYYRERHRRAHEGLPKEHGVGENETAPVISTVHENESLTYWTVKRSIDFLETRDDTRPFFLWTSFAKPHPPFDPCANYWALYDGREVPEPAIGDWSKTGEGTPQGYMFSTYVLNSVYRMSAAQVRDMRRAYYACITQIDYSLGLLFARMREMRLLENTWIIFTTDHGDMLGDHHMGAKTVFLEGSAHIPLIVRPPTACWSEALRGGKRVDAMADLTDIMPTIVDLAGVDLPDGIEGMSLVDLAAGGEEERTFVGNCRNTHFGIIRGKYKYTWTAIGGDALLFDLAEDPYEQRDLVRAGGYESTIKELRQVLIDHTEQICPQRVKNRDLVAETAIAGPQDVAKWPGFLSTVVDTDVLH